MTDAHWTAPTSTWGDFFRGLGRLAIAVVAVVLIVWLGVATWNWAFGTSPSRGAGGASLLAPAATNVPVPVKAPVLTAAEIAAQAYGSLGPLPDGGQVRGHSVTKEVKFTCPEDGKPGIQVLQTYEKKAGVMPNGAAVKGFTNARWDCNPNRFARR